MVRLLLFAFAILLLFMVGAILAFQYGGILGVVGVAAISLAFVLAVPRLVMRWAIGGLQRQIQEFEEVLRDARIEIHSISPSEPPEIDEYLAHDLELDESEAEDRTRIADDISSRRWFEFDFTLEPRVGNSGTTSAPRPWFPDSLVIESVDPPANEVADASDNVSNVNDVWSRIVGIWRADRFSELEQEELFGTQRLRFLCGVPRPVSKLEMSYFSLRLDCTFTLPRS